MGAEPSNLRHLRETETGTRHQVIHGPTDEIFRSAEPTIRRDLKIGPTMAYIKTNGYLTDAQYEQIEGETTDAAKVDRLLQILSTVEKGNSHAEILDTLKNTDQHGLAQEMKKNECASQ